MSTSTTTPAIQGSHPAPQRARLSSVSTWFALLAAPIAWSLQQLANAAIAAHGCFPHDEPVGAPLWHDLVAVSLSIDIAAFVVCLAAVFVAARNWRSTHTERPGSAHRLIGSGDGRTRFMAMASLMSSCLFLVAVIFSVGGLLVVGACPQ